MTVIGPLHGLASGHADVKALLHTLINGRRRPAGRPDSLWAWGAPIAGAAGPVPANIAARQARGRSRATLTSLLR